MRAKIVAGLLVLLALVVLPMLPEGAVRRALGGKAPGATEKWRMIEARDGLYTVADRSVACRVHGGWIACANDKVRIACQDDKCVPHSWVGDYEDGPLMVIPLDAQEQPAVVLRPGDALDFPRMNCWVEQTYLECRMADFGGGFQMSGLFARNSDWDDAPSGWPWNGKTYTLKDRIPGAY
ncbi:hypothetical protein [Phenylobacterium sp.]|uniref:hypothetical protein n=1 Tax=Phenylobacterium sp. TaxID=1871053 RepID=UPI00391C940B